MANYTTSSASFSNLVTATRYGHIPTNSIVNDAVLVYQDSRRYCTVVGLLPALVSCDRRLTYPPLPGKWLGNGLATGSGGGSGVASSEFPTVYGYIQ